jgi:flagellin-specific chaperone FliS
MPTGKKNLEGKAIQNSIIGNNILSKIEGIAETNQAIISKVSETVTGIASSLTQITGLILIQNKILTQIRDGLAKNSTPAKDKAQSAATGGFDFSGLAKHGGKLLKGVGTIVAMAAAVALAAGIFMLIPVDSPQVMLLKFGAALATVGVLYLIAPVFTKLMATLGSMKMTASLEYGDVKGSVGATDIMGMVFAAGGAFISMILMSVAIVASAKILSFMPDLDMSKLFSAVVVSLALLPMAVAFVGIMYILSTMKSSMSVNVAGAGGSTAGSDIMGMAIAMGGAFIAMILMSIALVATAYILKLMPDDTSLIKKAVIAGVIGLAMIPVAIAFGFLLKAFGTIGSNPIAVALALGAAVIALPLMMGALGLGVRALNLTMPSTYPTMPPLDWLLSFGILAVIGAAIFYGLSRAVKDLGLGGFIMTAIAIPVMFGAIAVGLWVWEKMRPEKIDYDNPIDPIWAFQMGLSLLAFTIPVAGIAFLNNKLGVQSVIVGIIGMAALMGAIGAGLKAFEFLGPDDPVAVAKTMSTVLMAPFMALTDTLAYFMNTIGLDNMGSLALGLIEVGAAWAIFATAVSAAGVGGAVGDSVSAIASIPGAVVGGVTNIIKDGYAFLTGSEREPEKAAQPKGVELLLILADNSSKIQGLVKPMSGVADAAVKFTNFSEKSFFGVRVLLSDLSKYATNTKRMTRLEKHMGILSTQWKNIATAQNSMDVEGITETTKMFKELNNFVNTSDVENVLTKLGEMFEKMTEALEESNKQGGNEMIKTLKELKDKLLGNETASTTAANTANIAPTIAGTTTTAPVAQNNNTADLQVAFKNLENLLSGTLKVQVVSNSLLG